MQDKSFQKAQQAYDRMEHPDYWEDSEEEYNDALERKIMAAEFRRDEIKEEQMIRGKRLPGDHDGWPSNEQMEYFKRGGR
jgi:hypothetical protein